MGIKLINECVIMLPAPNDYVAEEEDANLSMGLRMLITKIKISAYQTNR